jgi:quercetin dioxygenase-like cupin family protein
MKRTVVMLTLTVVGIVVGMVGNHVLIAQPEAVKRTVLLKTDLAGIDGKEGLMYIIEVAPGATLPKHYHPGHE